MTNKVPIKFDSQSSNGGRVIELADLRNIGKAMLMDFELLDISSVKQLARCNADVLYTKIQTITQSRHDPCVWDTYAAAIHQAKTGEALPWWDFTKIRKARDKSGVFAKRFGSGRRAVARSP
jgi:hypothetical protein